jgi:hypothetical protein
VPTNTDCAKKQKKREYIYTDLCILQDQSYIQTNTAPKKGQICIFTQQVLSFPLKGQKKSTRDAWIGWQFHKGMRMNIGSLLTLTLGVGESWAQAEIYKKLSVINSQSLYFVKRRICISYAMNGISLSQSIATV